MFLAKSAEARRLGRLLPQYQSYVCSRADHVSRSSWLTGLARRRGSEGPSLLGHPASLERARPRISPAVAPKPRPLRHLGPGGSKTVSPLHRGRVGS
jgi:hypothetical protein